MKVKDVMTARTLKSCSVDTKLQDAARAMKTANVGVLPVTDQNKKVVGIITDRDICLSLSQSHKKPHAEIPVSEVMEKRVHVVKENDDMEIALKQMRTNHVGRLPVVDQEGKLKGIVTMHNLFSKSLDGKQDIGSLTSPGESILKTVKALTDRYIRHEVEVEV